MSGMEPANLRPQVRLGPPFEQHERSNCETLTIVIVGSVKAPSAVVVDRRAWRSCIGELFARRLWAPRWQRGLVGPTCRSRCRVRAALGEMRCALACVRNRRYKRGMQAVVRDDRHTLAYILVLCLPVSCCRAHWPARADRECAPLRVVKLAAEHACAVYDRQAICKRSCISMCTLSRTARALPPFAFVTHAVVRVHVCGRLRVRQI
jgi:hypothetical protein